MRPHYEQPAALLCVILLLPCVLSQRPDYQLYQWQENKFWFWSSHAPMTKALDEIPDVVEGTKAILNHFERVEENILAKLGVHEPAKDGDFLQPCNCKDRQHWPRAVRSNFGVRGLPEPDLSCVTDFSGVQFTAEGGSTYTADELYVAILRRGHAIKANVKSIAARFIDVETNYTNPEFVFNYPYITNTATCVLHPVHGNRVGGRWRLATGIHNRLISQALPLFGRLNIVEFARVVDGHLTDNLLMRLPVRPKVGTERVVRDDATTLIVNTKGRANPSLFRDLPIEENPAIIQALDKASSAIHQAQTVTPSNIAIFSLPLVLNIIPIALITHVSIVQIVLYILLTDVLTVIPLLLRGLELLQIEGTAFRSIVVRLSSSVGTDRSDAAAAEMWAAECHVREGVRSVGIVIVPVSVAFLISGIVLDFIARFFISTRYRSRSELCKAQEGSPTTERQTHERKELQAEPEGGDADISQARSRSQDTGSKEPDSQGISEDNRDDTSYPGNLRRRKGKQTS